MHVPREGGGFAAALQEAAAGGRERAREAATRFVASAFILPVLAELREGSQATGPFAPGPAEKRFGPLLDTHLADRIVAGSRFGLVDSIVDRVAAPPAAAGGTEEAS